MRRGYRPGCDEEHVGLGRDGSTKETKKSNVALAVQIVGVSCVARTIVFGGKQANKEEQCFKT